MEQKTKKIGSYIKLRLRNQKDGTYGIIDNLSMTRDTNKGITSVSYDNSGMPQKVSFSTASYTQYNYSADGEKLKCMRLDWYDYGARHYDAAIVSWPTIERNDINGYGYTEGYMLPTSLKVDAIIKNTFVKSVMKGYDLVMNQCANAIKENNPYGIYIKRQ